MLWPPWPSCSPGLAAVDIDVVPSTHEFLDLGPQASRASPDFLAMTYGESGTLAPDCVLMTAGGDAGVEVGAVDIGMPEDPEGGRTLFVTTSLDRTPASFLLGAAMAVAASRLTGNPIWDEDLLLTGERVVQPAEAVARLRTELPGATDLQDLAATSVRGLGLTTPD